MFCHNCGKMIPDSAKFCKHCGASQNHKEGEKQEKESPEIPDIEINNETTNSDFAPNNYTNSVGPNSSRPGVQRVPVAKDSSAPPPYPNTTQHYPDSTPPYNPTQPVYPPLIPQTPPKSSTASTILKILAGAVAATVTVAVIASEAANHTIYYLFNPTTAAETTTEEEYQETTEDYMETTDYEYEEDYPDNSENTSPFYLTEPQTGDIIFGREYYYESELTIHATDYESVVVKVKDSYGDTKVIFYVGAGDSVTIGVPADYLQIFFASGTTWYNPEELFGPETSYSKDDEILDFTVNTYEYTLSLVEDGNFEETPIDSSEF